MAAFFLIDMHQNLEKPPESLGIEMEPDENDTSDFQQRYIVCYGFMWLFYSQLEISVLKQRGITKSTELLYYVQFILEIPCLLAHRHIHTNKYKYMYIMYRINLINNINTVLKYHTKQMFHGNTCKKWAPKTMTFKLCHWQWNGMWRKDSSTRSSTLYYEMFTM